MLGLLVIGSPSRFGRSMDPTPSTALAKNIIRRPGIETHDGERQVKRARFGDIHVDDKDEGEISDDAQHPVDDGGVAEARHVDTNEVTRGSGVGPMHDPSTESVAFISRDNRLDLTRFSQPCRLPG
jgi:hypothetical protein